MPEMSLIASALAGVKTAMDMTKAVLGLHVSGEVKAAVSDIREKLIDAQSTIFQAQIEQSTLAQRVRELEEELVRAKDWDTQKQRYKLQTLPTDFGGAVAYALKESKSDGEPPHWICTACYQRGIRSILHPKYAVSGHGRAGLACSGCSAEIGYAYAGALPGPTYAAD